MRSVWILAACGVVATATAADPAESRIEQLMQAPARSAPAPKAAERKTTKAEADGVAGLVGQRVAVETRQRGIYIGTLSAVTRDTLVLAIALPSRSLSYSVARADVSSVTAR